jgi:pyruvate dehydrogenase E1 component beta subunit
MHVPGLKVVAPTTPHDAKGCLMESLRADGPVIFVEHRMLHGVRGHVPVEPYQVPFGRARVLAPGRDVTLVGISHMALECERARMLLQGAGVLAEVIDPVTLAPLDVDTIARSAARTGRLLVVDTAWTTCGASAEIAMQVVERLGSSAAVRVGRLGFAPVPCPTAPVLEQHFYPGARQIAAAAYALVGNTREWAPAHADAPEVMEFRGPF